MCDSLLCHSGFWEVEHRLSGLVVSAFTVSHLSGPYFCFIELGSHTAEVGLELLILLSLLPRNLDHRPIWWHNAFFLLSCFKPRGEGPRAMG